MSCTRAKRRWTNSEGQWVSRMFEAPIRLTESILYLVNIKTVLRGPFRQIWDEICLIALLYIGEGVILRL